MRHANRVRCVCCEKPKVSLKTPDWIAFVVYKPSRDPFISDAYLASDMQFWGHCMMGLTKMVLQIAACVPPHVCKRGPMGHELLTKSTCTITHTDSMQHSTPPSGLAYHIDIPSISPEA
jgi:hypothetical protein